MTIEEAIQILDPGTRREALREIPVMERIEADQAACRIAVAALRAQQAPDNAPLTLEELREMDGEPVWCVNGSGSKRWAIVCVYGENPDEFECYTTQYGRIPGWHYGMEGGAGWLAYRRKPEEGTA